MYAAFAPPLHYDAASRAWIGGLFWDGRASSLEQQASGPLLGPLEMNNPDKASVVAAVRRAPYAAAFRDVFGAHALDDDDLAFGHVPGALAAFERTRALAPFSSKYDRYLAGEDTLTASEQRGLAVFENPARGDCASCHPSRPSADGTPPLFTNFGYANLGLPTYRNSRFFAQAAAFDPAGDRCVDHGLMTTVGDPAQDGKVSRAHAAQRRAHRPVRPQWLLRESPVHDRLPEHARRSLARPRGPAVGRAEVPATVERGRLGHLGLTPGEVDDLVAFLGTLTDAPPRDTSR